MENRLYTAINLTNGTNVTNYIVFRVRSSHDISRNIRCKIERNGHFYLHKESFRMFDTEPSTEKKRRKFSRTRKIRRRMELDGSERKERNLKERLDIFVS